MTTIRPEIWEIKMNDGPLGEKAGERGNAEQKGHLVADRILTLVLTVLIVWVLAIAFAWLRGRAGAG